MQLGLRTKLTMVMTGLVLLSTAVLSAGVRRTASAAGTARYGQASERIGQRDVRFRLPGPARRASRGLRPASDDSEDIHEYVQNAFEDSEGLAARLQLATDSPSIYEVYDRGSGMTWCWFRAIPSRWGKRRCGGLRFRNWYKAPSCGRCASWRSRRIFTSWIFRSSFAAILMEKCALRFRRHWCATISNRD